MKKTRWRILTLLWALSIMTGATIRGYRMGSVLQTVGPSHIAVHAGVFAVLGLLLMLSFNTVRGQLLAVLAGVALGFGTELYEHLAFRGSMEFGDVLIDAVGVLLGAGATFLTRPSRYQTSASR
jgi:hypothetical protein